MDKQMGWDKIDGTLELAQDTFPLYDIHCGKCAENGVACPISIRLFLFTDKIDNIYIRMEVERVNHEYIAYQSMYKDKPSAILTYQESRTIASEEIATNDIKRKIFQTITANGAAINTISDARSRAGFYFSYP